jgi:hypothetical protein
VDQTLPDCHGDKIHTRKRENGVLFINLSGEKFVINFGIQAVKSRWFQLISNEKKKLKYYLKK